MIQCDESLSKPALFIQCSDRIIGDGRHLENPFSLDVTQAQCKQTDTECPEDKKVKCERHDILAVDRTLENVDAVGYR